MHETDIARTRRQVEKVAERAQKIAEETETISEAGFDPSTSDAILAKQQALVEELGQALADFNELSNRAETIETERINYEPSGKDLTVTHDDTAEEVTIEYTGTVDIDLADITVTQAGTEITPFNSTVTNGTSATIDASGMNDEETVTVEVVTYRQTPGQVSIKPWSDVIGSDTGPEISVTGIQLPEHNLVSDTNTLTRSVTIVATGSTV